MLVTRTAAQTPYVDAQGPRMVAVVNVPVMADYQPRIW